MTEIWCKVLLILLGVIFSIIVIIALIGSGVLMAIWTVVSIFIAALLGIVNFFIWLYNTVFNRDAEYICRSKFLSGYFNIE